MKQCFIKAYKRQNSILHIISQSFRQTLRKDIFPLAKNGLIIFLITFLGSGNLLFVLTPSTFASTPPTSQLFISEVADPSVEGVDTNRNNFVELYNASSETVDLTGWKIVRQNNGGSGYTLALSGTLTAGNTYAIARYDFHDYSGVTFDVYDVDIANGDGNDGYFLYYETTLVDSYGALGQNGSGRTWEYTNKNAVRIPTITQANTVWTASEWKVITSPVSYTAMNPKVNPENYTSPTINNDTSVNYPNQNITLNFSDNLDWRNGITAITVNGVSATEKYTLNSGEVIIDGSLFSSVTDYNINIKSLGYNDANLTQSIENGVVSVEKVLISEIGFPSDSTSANFIELHNSSDASVNLSGWYLSIHKEDNSWVDIALNYNLASKQTFYLLYNKGSFDASFANNPIISNYAESSNLVSNGNNTFHLYKDGSHTSGTLVDSFGLHNLSTFSDTAVLGGWYHYRGRGVRNTVVASSSPDFVKSEWTISTNQPTTNMTIGLHPDEKLAPTLTADTTNNYLNQDMIISFTDDVTWRQSVVDRGSIKLNSAILSSSGYNLESGLLTIYGGQFGNYGEYEVSIVVPKTSTATGYNTTVANQVVLALNSDKEVTSFNFLAASNTSLSVDITGQVTSSTGSVVLTLPYGNDVTSLIPNITMTGVTVSPASTTAQDFTSSVNYVITAEDGTSKNYLVSVVFETPVATELNFATSIVTVSEGDGTYSLAVSITNPSVTAATQVDLVLTSGSNAQINDYTTQSVVFPIGSSADQVVTLNISNDSVTETNQTLTFTLQNQSGGNSPTIGSTDSFDLILVDDDNTSVEFTSASATVGEASTTYSVSATISNPNSAEATTVDLVLTNSGFLSDLSGYGSTALGTITFPAGSVNGATVSLSLNVNDDSDFEATETLPLQLQNISGGVNPTIGVQDTFNLIILDNDQTTVQFSLAEVIVSEASSTYALNLSITNPSATVDTTLNLALTSGDNTDINSYTTQAVTFPAASSADQIVTITITDDSLAEGSEVFGFALQDIAGGNANSAVVGSLGTFNLTITDNDNTIIEFTGSTGSVSEGNQIGIPVKITRPSNTTITTVYVNLITGNASDLSGVSSQRVDFPITAAEGDILNATFNATLGDGSELDELFTFELQNATGGSNVIVDEDNKQFALTVFDKDAVYNLMISEVADPSDTTYGDYVELYNAGTSAVDFDTNTWYLARYNSGAWSEYQLVGSMSAGDKYIVGLFGNPDNFDSVYSNTISNNLKFLTASMTHGGTESYFLYKNGNHSAGTLVDSYGILEDGTGKTWNYTGARAFRKASITQANRNWTTAEWNIVKPSTKTQMTPGVHPNGSDNTSLSDLKLNNVTISGFNASTYSYNQDLNYGIALPTITTTKADSNASVNIVTATTSIVTVTAQDGYSTSTYTVLFNSLANVLPVAVTDNVTIAEDNTLTVSVLDNDTDVDNGVLSLVSLNASTTNGGTASSSANNVIYTPALGWSGSDSFVYTINDNQGGTATATVNITVTAVNDAPTAVSDSATTIEDTAFYTYFIFDDLISNDTDPEGDALSVVRNSFIQASNGVVEQGLTYFKYLPNANFSGVDSFSYVVSDVHGATSAGVVNITVTAVNDSPTAVPDSATTAEDTAIEVDVRLNDTDVEDASSSLIVSLVTNASNGNAVVNTNKITYTPNANFTGEDTFTYFVADTVGATSSVVVVTVTVTNSNDAPTAVLDSATTSEDTAIEIGVRDNDTDIEDASSSLVVSLDTNASNGTAVVNTNNTITYTPNANYNGSDSFTYFVTDTLGATSSAVAVSVTVTAVNDAPVVVVDSITTPEETLVEVSVRDNDTDTEDASSTLVVTMAVAPTHGVASIVSNNIRYTPETNYVGTDEITYFVTDTEGATSSVVALTVTITNINDAPVAVLDSATTSEDTAVEINVRDNDTDTEDASSSLIVSLDTDASNGSAVVNTNNTITYTPNANYNGSDSFTYFVADTVGATSSAVTVNVTVASINDAPVAVVDSATTLEDIAVEINVRLNDTDVEDASSSLAVSLDTNASNGSAVVNANNIIYTPNANYNGSDSFTYFVTDTLGATSSAVTVSVTVTSVNDAPVSVSDSATTVEDTLLSLDLRNNDSDTEDASSSLTVVLDTNPSHGVATITSQNILEYTPGTDSTTTVDFTYHLVDSVGSSSNTSTVTVTITAVSDAPVAVADNVTTVEDNAITFNVLNNDTDIDTPTTSLQFVSIVDYPADYAQSGTLATNVNGDITYTPTSDFYGTVSFTYKVRDDLNLFSTTTVTVTVTSVNDLPVAVSDDYIVYEDNQLSANLISNDSDKTNETPHGSLTVSTTPITATSNGVLNINSDGTFTYDPTANYVGSDSFVYQLNDTDGGTATTTVTITVSPQNDAPEFSVVPTGANLFTSEDTLYSSVVEATDDDTGDVLTFSSANLPSWLSLTNNGDKTATLSGTSSNSEVGVHTFTLEVKDQLLATGTSEVTITVNNTNDAPVITSSPATSTQQYTAYTYNLTTQDDDNSNSVDHVVLSVSGNPSWLTLGSVDTTNGTAILSGTPSLESQIRTSSITVTATDSSGATSTQVFTLEVTNFNDAPVANVDGPYYTNEDIATSSNVLTNDTDSDTASATLQAVLETGPSNGVLGLTQNNGDFIYTPNANWYGTDSFTYKTYDGEKYSAVATVTIVVASVEDVPVFTSSPATSTLQHAVYTYSVTSQENDGENVTVSVVSKPTWLSLTSVNPASGTASLVGTPDDQSTVGTSTIELKVTDTSGTSTIQTYTLEVVDVNDAPVVVSDLNYRTDEDVATSVNATLGVLNNDTDAETASNLLQVTLVSGPDHKESFVLNTDGSFDYTPTINWNGQDSFVYKVYDGELYSGTTTVTITVDPINDTPVASVDTYSVNEDTALDSGNVRDNDTDIETSNADMTVNLVTTTASGTLALSSNGTFTYTPNANWNGVDTFVYQLNDGQGGTSTAIATITVVPVNDAPVVASENYRTNEDTATSSNVLTNDMDLESDSMTAVLVTDSTNGTTTLNSDGTFTYTPNVDYNGTDSFTYKVFDGALYSLVATATIIVDPINDNPSANVDTYSFDEDTTLNAGDVRTNDTDVETSNADMTINLVTTTASGTLALSSNGTFTYTPNADWYGVDTFVYQLNDGQGGTATTTATITILNINDAPVSVDDSTSTTEDIVLSFEVRDNDSDIDNATSTLTVALDSQPSHGVATVTASNTIQYTPGLNATNTVTFTYHLVDSAGSSSNVSTLTVTIVSVNDVPTFTSTAVLSALENSQYSYAITTNDVDGELVGITSTTLASWLTLTDNGDGTATLVGTPAQANLGANLVSLNATDPNGATSTQDFTITVTDINIAPVSVNDVYTTNEDTATSVDATLGILANDSDADGDTLKIEIVTNTAQGTLSLNEDDGSFTYHPDNNFNGTDTFTYQVYDGLVRSNTSSVTITVDSINDAPVTVTDSYNAVEDTSLSVSSPGILSNDSDIETTDKNNLAITMLSSTTKGDVVLDTNSGSTTGGFVYTPNLNATGTDSFIYQISDGEAVATTTVVIEITAVNDIPVAVTDSYRTNEDVATSSNVLTNDTDVDNATTTLTASLVTDTTNGTTVLNSDGTFTYTPNANYNGTDSFTYTASDVDSTSTAMTVTIVIDPVVDNPEAVTDAYQVSKNTVLTVNQTNGLATNDLNVDSSSLNLTVATTTNPAKGDLVLNANGSFTYTPNLNATGTDSFSYQASNAVATSVATSVVITIIEMPTINSFDLLAGSNTSISSDVIGSINNTNVILEILQGTSLINLNPTIVVSTGAVVSPASGVAHTFTLGTSETYTVSFGGLTQDYAITINDKPVVSNVHINSIFKVGEILHGRYEFTDAQGEGSSTFKWYRADDISGTNEAELTATSSTYTLVAEDESKYIAFEIIPVDALGTAGDMVRSGYTTSILAASTTVVHFATPSAIVSEGAGTYNVEVTIGEPSLTNTTTVDIVLESGSASDLNNFSLSMVSFAPGVTTSQMVAITITDDSEIEGDEVFTFKFNNSTGGNNAQLDPMEEFTLTVTNNDVVSTPVSTPSGGGGGGGGSSRTVTKTPQVSSFTIGSEGLTDSATTTNNFVTLNIQATDVDQMMLSNTEDFASSQWENFTTTKIWQLEAGQGIKTVYAKLKHSSNSAFKLVTDTINYMNGIIPQVLGVKVTDEDSSETSARDQQVKEVHDDAFYVWPSDVYLLLDYRKASRSIETEQAVYQKYTKSLVSEEKDLTTASIWAMNNYISYSGYVSEKIGAGERAGVLNSYQAAFDKLPTTEEEWRDVIKVSVGRFPEERSVSAETRAKEIFKKIYLRDANMDKENEKAAVMVAAYGLRPDPRNTNSEVNAVNIFRGIYGHTPSSAVDWDTVRMIAYSGVAR